MLDLKFAVFDTVGKMLCDIQKLYNLRIKAGETLISCGFNDLTEHRRRYFLIDNVWK